jgi:SAM-dependent methyltransferase
VTVPEARQAHQLNRLAWNEAAQAYTSGLDGQIARLRGGNVSLHPIERAHLGDLSEWCRTAVHLQCASGEDTLSLLNAGARQVVGVDISEVHIANSEAATSALGADARWYCCDVLDTPEELNGWADLVYTGRGALVWLHDITTWGQVVARLLKPGGVFHILDDHPAAYLFDPEAADLTPSQADYFHHVETCRGWTPQYIGDLGKPTEDHPEKHERFWTIAEVFTALISAGLVVDLLGEHPDPYWSAFPHLPENTRRKLPMTFSLRAHKPHRPAAGSV